MAEIANTSWYRTGTVAVTQNDATITGTNTLWTAAGINPGATFRIDGSSMDYEVLEVVDDTHITLRTPFTSFTASGKSYSIDRNHQSTPLADLAADVASVMHKYEKHIDAQTHTVTGMSAFELAVKNGYVGTESDWIAQQSAYGVAVRNGFTGTEAEWLESLKAAGEWSTLNARTEMLTFTQNKVGGLRNVIYRGKSLGTEFTDAQAEAIRSGVFTDLYLGDYWTDATNNMTWTIAGFNNMNFSGGRVGDANHISLVSSSLLPGANYENTYWTPDQTLSAYIDSNYYVNVRPRLIGYLEEFFGADHLRTWEDYSYTCDANGNYTGFTLLRGAKCEMLHYKQVFEMEPFINNGTHQMVYGFWGFYEQLPLFRVYQPSKRGNGIQYTLFDLPGNGRWLYHVARDSVMSWLGYVNSHPVGVRVLSCLK